MQIPALPVQTGCRFRKMEVRDAEKILEIHSDIDTQHFTRLLRQQTLEDIKSWLQYYPHYDRHGFGLWAIEHIATETLAGLCGLRVRKDLNYQTDVSYRMHPKFRGRGIATAAVSTCLNWGFEALKIKELLAQVHKDNVVSMHILTKQGFVKRSEDGIWVDLVLKSTVKTVK
jgi:ribosomal-protein-alanine N-acetyltransferase